MSEISLNLFSIFPGEVQEKMLLSGLNILLTSGDLAAADSIVDQALALSFSKKFQAEAALCGISIAVVEGNFKRALRRYNFIASLGGEFCGSEKTGIDALFYLSAFLPQNADIIFELWRNILANARPSRETGKTLARTGALLWSAFGEAGEKDRQAKTAELMDRFLGARVPAAGSGEPGKNGGGEEN